MGITHNVVDGAIDVDSPEFQERFGPQADDGSEFDPPADFDDSQVPEIIRSMNKPKRTPKPKLTAKQQAAEQRRKDREAEKKLQEKMKAKALKEKERAEAKAKRDAEREAARAAKQAAKEAGPDLSDLVASKTLDKATVQNIPLDQLDGIDGGDPVDASFVENVRLHGVLVPIMVRATDDGRYNIVYGKRRSQAARAVGKATIPAVVEKRNDSNDYVLALAENYSRSNNLIEEHRMVMALLDHFAQQGITGANDRKAVQAIAKATGMAVSQIKKARDVGRLVPELMNAVEDGTMSSWSALRVSRLPVEAQRRLVDTLESEGRITVDDVNIATRHKQHEAVGKIVEQAAEGGQDLFDVPAVEGEGTESVAPAAKLNRTEQVAQIVRHAQAALTLAEGLKSPSQDEKDAVALLTQIIENLTTPAA